MFSFRRLLWLLTVLFAVVLSLQSAKALTFVQITDPQFGMGDRGYQQDVTTFKSAITQINALKPDFVLICGDLINNWTPAAATDFLTCAKDFTMPWYVAAGNHDDWKSDAFHRDFAPDQRVVEQGNTTVLVVNTNIWRDGSAEAADQQLAWLEKSLQQATDKHHTIVVAGHHPLFVRAVDEKETYENIPLARRLKILALFEQYKVAAYLTGHLHYNLVAAYHGTLLISNASTAKNFSGEKPGFRVWHIDDSGYITHEYVPAVPTENK